MRYYKPFLLLALLISMTAKAQITLEHTYDLAASNLYMIDLEVEGEKYVKIQRSDTMLRFIKLYNLDHSLWKTIDCNGMPMFTHLAGIGALNNGRFGFDALYITQHLFDADDEVEFMYTVNTGLCPQFFTGIYNEDGSPVFVKDSAAPIVKLNIPVVAKPIYNTAAGTKMILSFPCSKKARVYSIPGIVTDANMFITEDEELKSLAAYPNPGNGKITIGYSLPDDVNAGEIILYDMSGIQIKKYTVDHSFNSLEIDNSDLADGTYLYCLRSGPQILSTKKIVVTR